MRSIHTNIKRKTKRESKKRTTLKAHHLTQPQGTDFVNSGNSCKKSSKKKQASRHRIRVSPGTGLRDLELLEMLIKKIIEKLEKNSCETKVGDALKAIQLKQRLASTSDGRSSSGRSGISQASRHRIRAERMFWEMIDQIRKEELSKHEFCVKRPELSSKEPRRKREKP
ncbi:MAG: hypothetical protein ACE5K2_00305 [Candidatus Zixiibacteriota bacterium]